MKDNRSEIITYVPLGAHDQRLTERYQERQKRRQPGFGARKPDKAPADITTWLGGRKASPAVQQHNRQLDKIEFAAVEGEYALRMGFRLEHAAVSEASRTVAAEVAVYRSQPPDSLEATITQELVLDSVDRIRGLATEVNEGYREKIRG